MNADTLSTGVFDQFLSRAKRFYAPSAVAVRAIELAAQPPADLAAISECVASDPALAAKLVRLANCSLFGLNPRVDSVKEVLERLGPDSFQLLMLGCSVPTAPTTRLAENFRMLFWHYFLIAAAASSEIASHWYRLSPIESFAGGVIRGLGILSLVHELGDSYASFLLEVWSSVEDLSVQEGRVLGFDHTQLGVNLLERQRLPANLGDAMKLSFDAARMDSAEPSQRSLAQVLHLADLVARLFANDRYELLDVLNRTGNKYCGMTPEQLEALASELQPKVLDLAAALQIEVPKRSTYSQMLHEAQKQFEEQVHSSSQEIPSHSSIDSALARDHDEEDEDSADEPVGASLMDRIAGAVARCRQARCPLSLVLTQVDEPHSATENGNGSSHAKIVRKLNSAIRHIVKQDGRATRVSDTQFALILERYDRRHAVELAWRIVDTIRMWSDGEPGECSRLTVSVGLATLAMPPRNFPAERIVTAAQRCLNGVQLSGGDSVKSIDII